MHQWCAVQEPAGALPLPPPPLPPPAAASGAGACLLLLPRCPGSTRLTCAAASFRSLARFWRSARFCWRVRAGAPGACPLSAWRWGGMLGRSAASMGGAQPLGVRFVCLHGTAAPAASAGCTTQCGRCAECLACAARRAGAPAAAPPPPLGRRRRAQQADGCQVQPPSTGWPCHADERDPGTRFRGSRLHSAPPGRPPTPSSPAGLQPAASARPTREPDPCWRRQHEQQRRHRLHGALPGGAAAAASGGSSSSSWRVRAPIPPMHSNLAAVHRAVAAAELPVWPLAHRRRGGVCRLAPLLRLCQPQARGAGAPRVLSCAQWSRCRLCAADSRSCIMQAQQGWAR